MKLNREKPEIMGAYNNVLYLFKRKPYWLYLRLFKGWKLRRINYTCGLPDIWLEKQIDSISQEGA